MRSWQDACQSNATPEYLLVSQPAPVSMFPHLQMYVNTVNHTGSCSHCGYPYCRTTPCTPANDGISDYNRWWSSETSANPLFIEVDTMDPFYENNTQVSFSRASLVVVVKLVIHPTTSVQ